MMLCRVENQPRAAQMFEKMLEMLLEEPGRVSQEMIMQAVACIMTQFTELEDDCPPRQQEVSNFFNPEYDQEAGLMPPPGMLRSTGALLQGSCLLTLIKRSV